MNLRRMSSRAALLAVLCTAAVQQALTAKRAVTYGSAISLAHEGTGNRSAAATALAASTASAAAATKSALAGAAAVQPAQPPLLLFSGFFRARFLGAQALWDRPS